MSVLPEPEQLFKILNGVLIGYALLILAPRWKYTKVLTLIVALFYAIIYVIGISSVLISSKTPLDFSDMHALIGAFNDPKLFVVAWDHYICFDFLVSRWQVFDAVNHKIPHLVVVPCVVLTLMFGPVGWTLYMVLRLVYTGTLGF